MGPGRNGRRLRSTPSESGASSNRSRGGESYAEVAARMRDLLGEVARRWAGKRVLIIGHRATWYSLERLVNGRDLREVISGPWAWQPGWTYHLRL